MESDKQAKKEAARLEKYKRQLAKPGSGFSVFMMFGLIILVHLLDTYTSDISGKVQSSYINEFLIQGRGFTEGAALQYVSVLTIFTVLFALLAPFYKALMDRFGRRPIFIINILGMCAGLFLCYVAPTMEVMMAGMVIIAFFVIHDLQMVYVYEVAPSKWRSTIYFTCKFIGVFGTLAIPLMRRLYMTPDGGNWRPLYLIPAVIGVAIFVLSLIFMRESDVFLKNQIDYLSVPAEARPKDKKGKDERKTGIGPAIKLCLRDKQLRWLMIAAACAFTAAVGIAQNYEVFMSFDANMSTDQITFALFVQIVVMGLAQLVNGFLADFFGRKAATAVFAVATVAALCLFVVLSPAGAGPWLVGLLLGLLIGCYWNVTDLNGMMIAESAPTELRGSVVGVQGLAVLAGTLLSVVINAVLLGFTGLGTAKLIIGIPGVVVSALIILLKVRETKGADLEKAGRA